MEDYVPPGMESSKVKLITSDNVTREVDVNLLKKCILLKDNQGGEEVKLNEVDDKNLVLIIQYLDIIKTWNQKKFLNLFLKELMKNL